MTVNIRSLLAHRDELIAYAEENDFNVIAIQEERIQEASLHSFAAFHSAKNSKHNFVGTSLHCRHGIIAKRPPAVKKLLRNLCSVGAECAAASFLTSKGNSIIIAAIFLHPAFSHELACEAWSIIDEFLKNNPSSIILEDFDGKIDAVRKWTNQSNWKGVPRNS
eukprot:TRINITY_DN17269_c0_g1_i1.p1 TRINITY_DN17269_c0_g1~~TRINITY_DN17269_c0_g1_i1.p1  ORF type:complete len:164 (+),score=30.84 TRINITY_DN17269_c0_g1_i1:1315-1806(+)